MIKCKICSSEKVKTLLDCGDQTLCNRFVHDPKTKEYKYSLTLGQCQFCGLIQLVHTVPAEEIKPRFNWLKYNEPEDHLDFLAHVITELDGITSNSVVCGITYKDDSLLERLRKKKSVKTWRIDSKEDLNINNTGVCTETILPLLTEENVNRIIRKRGKADVLIARHIYEHSPEAKLLVNNLKKMIKPGGYIVFEIPDCLPLLRQNDYNMLWEEHILYFTPFTFQNSLKYSDFDTIYYNSFSYPIENAVVAIVKSKKNIVLESHMDINKELDCAASYSQGFYSTKNRICEYLKNHTETKGKIAVFGAGHVASMFINLMEIKDYIEFVVDDDSNKRELYMPGSKLEIKGSNSLLIEDIGLCLLTLSPDSENKVIAKNKKFIENGGVFASVFKLSENSIKI